MRSDRGGVRLAACALALAAVSAPVPARADDAAFKETEARYRKLARNKDDAANRERRKLLLSLFDMRGLKACKKLLRDAYDEEPTPDNRIAVVQVLAATGDPKDLDFLLGAFKKEKVPGPQIALALGLSFTDPSAAPQVATHVAGLLGRQKGEVARSLLEGLGRLGDPGAFDALVALGEKLPPAERFERVVALGACGRAGAKDALERAAAAPDAETRLAAALGLGRTGGTDPAPAAEALPALIALVGDADPRVVEAAAEALARTKHEPAVKPLAEALRRAPLRTREALRAALKAITARDCGHDAGAWLEAGGKAAAPKLPACGTLEIPSDRVALILDLSRSMDWNSRLDRARELLSGYLATLPPDVTIGVVAAGRTPAPMLGQLQTGASATAQADTFLREQRTAGGCDLKEALNFVLSAWPAVDTIVVATDSLPMGETADDRPLEIVQELRRDLRTRRVRIFPVFVAPGGRRLPEEDDRAEYEERKEVLAELAETTGAKSLVVE